MYLGQPDYFEIKLYGYGLLKSQINIHIDQLLNILILIDE